METPEIHYATNIELTPAPKEPGIDPNPRALVRLQKDELQQLMDELWHVGIRPSEGTGSAGQLAATQKHLDDMRRVALHGLGIAAGPK